METTTVEVKKLPTWIHDSYKVLAKERKTTANALMVKVLSRYIRQEMGHEDPIAIINGIEIWDR